MSKRAFEMGPAKRYNEAMAWKDFFRVSLRSRLAGFLGGENREAMAEELLETLLLADVAMNLAETVVHSVKKKCPASATREEFLSLVRNELETIFLAAVSSPLRLDGKDVWLLVGSNGCGKTTTAAKLAFHFSARGKRVLLAAADTFRAAGADQLAIWGERLGIPIISGERGADPGSVVYNSLQSFQSKEYDLLLVDTAGRVQSRESLMRELEKMVKIVDKFFPDQPAESLLVLDAATGQNALVQAERFHAFSKTSGIVLAKMDGTAKGGTVLNIVERMKLPVRFVGSGETEKDLEEFSAAEYVAALVGENSSQQVKS